MRFALSTAILGAFAAMSVAAPADDPKMPDLSGIADALKGAAGSGTSGGSSGGSSSGAKCDMGGCIQQIRPVIGDCAGVMASQGKDIAADTKCMSSMVKALGPDPLNSSCGVCLQDIMSQAQAAGAN